MIVPKVRKGSHSLYHGRFFLVFYDESDEQLLYIFDNCREILKFQNKEITRENINAINFYLFKALSRENHYCRFLTGKPMRVYLIDIKDNDEYENIKDESKEENL